MDLETASAPGKRTRIGISLPAKDLGWTGPPFVNFFRVCLPSGGAGTGAPPGRPLARPNVMYFLRKECRSLSFASTRFSSTASRHMGSVRFARERFSTPLSVVEVPEATPGRFMAQIREEVIKEEGRHLVSYPFSLHRPTPVSEVLFSCRLSPRAGSCSPPFTGTGLIPVR